VPAERYVDLAPQVADVDLDDVGLTVERRVPHGVEDLALDQAGDRREALVDAEVLAQQPGGGGEVALCDVSPDRPEKPRMT